MKLSQAIMFNGMTKPQGFGYTTFYSVDSPCALGGALQAIGRPQNYDHLVDAWPWIEDESFSCPACDDMLVNTEAKRVIWHLNDLHEWTRQQIAEWVARIEPQEHEQTIEELVETAEVVND